jgi:hypothetical protein
MAPGDHPKTAAAAEGESSSSDSHWVRWHRHYDDPSSPLSVRLRIVQAMVADVLSAAADVLATHPRAVDATALLVELDPVLVAFARERAAAAGVTGNVRIVGGDAALSRWYADDVPADLVLVCGVFGNVSGADISRTIQALPGWCREGSEVIWTRHRRPPDATPFIRAEFAAAGFDEVAFEAPDGYVLSVGRNRLERPPDAFDPGATLFEFVGDGLLPARLPSSRSR